MVFLIVIAIIAFIAVLIDKNSNSQKKYKERELYEPQYYVQRINNSENEGVVNEQDEYADIFRDRIKTNSIYQDEEPSEARRILREAKEYGEWLSDDDYLALRDAIAASKDYDYFRQIELLTPAETLKWFNAKMKRNVKMSSNIWEEVAKKVAPMQENELLAELEQVTPGRVRTWLSRKKSEGYFFTERAYKQAFEKHLQRRKKKK